MSRTSPAALASRTDATRFQKRVLLYTQMYKRVSPSLEHANRMGVPLSNLRVAIKALREMRMLALDPLADEEEYGITQRGVDVL